MNVALTIALSWLLLAHPVPEGLLFRSMEIVIRSDVIEIRYQLGLSDSMVQAELRRLGSAVEDVPEDGVEALAEYRDAIYAEIPRNLTAAINERPVVLLPIRADIVRQQHAQIELTYHVPLDAEATSTRFELIDENFPGVDGYHIAALRSRARFELIQTGARQLPQRVPNLADAGMPGWEPPPPMRQVQAILRIPPAAAETRSEPAEAGKTPPSTPMASIKRQDTAEITRSPPAESRAESELGWAWTLSFAFLAFVVAIAWLVNARGRSNRGSVRP